MAFFGLNWLQGPNSNSLFRALIGEGFSLSIWFGYYKRFLRSFVLSPVTNRPKSTRKYLLDFGKSVFVDWLKELHNFQNLFWKIASDPGLLANLLWQLNRPFLALENSEKLKLKNGKIIRISKVTAAKGEKKRAASKQQILSTCSQQVIVKIWESLAFWGGNIYR